GPRLRFSARMAMPHVTWVWGTSRARRRRQHDHHPATRRPWQAGRAPGGPGDEAWPGRRSIQGRRHDDGNRERDPQQQGGLVHERYTGLPAVRVLGGDHEDPPGPRQAVPHGRRPELSREARRDQALLQLADDPAGLRARQVHRWLRHRPRPAPEWRTSARRGGSVRGLSSRGVHRMADVDAIKRRLKEERIPEALWPDEWGEKKKRPREVAFMDVNL